jgi:AraC-like DNA-binding protein
MSAIAMEEFGSMLISRTVASADGVALIDVSCRHPAGPGRHVELAMGDALVFVRRGCFIRNVDGGEALLDPTVAYCQRAGQEQRYDHPHANGDDCTVVGLDPPLLASLLGGQPALPQGPIPTSPQLDLEHRKLLAAARAGTDLQELVERAINLAAGALEQVEPTAVAAGRPSTAAERRKLADGVREALASDPGRSLPELARELSVSPHHLSRVFRSVCGHSIARHRMRLRVRVALERLVRGERHLARLAADVGFADQSHLCRVIRAELGSTPAALRAALA